MKDLSNLILIFAAFTLGYCHTGGFYWVQYVVGLCAAVFAWFGFNILMHPHPEREKMTDDEWEECYFLAYYLNMGYEDIKVLTSEKRQILIDKFNEDVSKKRKGLE